MGEKGGELETPILQLENLWEEGNCPFYSTPSAEPPQPVAKSFLLPSVREGLGFQVLIFAAEGEAILRPSAGDLTSPALLLLLFRSALRRPISLSSLWAIHGPHDMVYAHYTHSTIH